MGFLVVPVVGKIGGDDAELAEPDEFVMCEIRQALEAFRPDQKSVH